MADTEPVPFDFAALTEAWMDFAAAMGIPLGYKGDSTPAAHDGVENAQSQLRRHIIATDDYRLFALLHILGNASLRMEQVLDPDGYAESLARIKAALVEAEFYATQGQSIQFAPAVATSLLRRD